MPIYVNQYRTTLNGAINDTTTSLSVVDSPPANLTTPFPIRIDDEILSVTAVGGTGNKDWTVVREAEDPSRFPAASHGDGATVKQTLTAGSLAIAARDPASLVYAYQNFT